MAWDRGDMLEIMSVWWPATQIMLPVILKVVFKKKSVILSSGVCHMLTFWTQF